MNTITRWCATGSVHDRTRSGPPRKVPEAHYQCIDSAMAENDELTASRDSSGRKGSEGGRDGQEKEGKRGKQKQKAREDSTQVEEVDENIYQECGAHYDEDEFSRCMDRM